MIHPVVMAMIVNVAATLTARLMAMLPVLFAT
jgi:hypothetical protein